MLGRGSPFHQQRNHRLQAHLQASEVGRRAEGRAPISPLPHRAEQNTSWPLDAAPEHRHLGHTVTKIRIHLHQFCHLL